MSEPTKTPPLTEWEILVMTDCLHGSLGIAGGGIWKFSREQRNQVLDLAYKRMTETETNQTKTPQSVTIPK